MGAFKRRTTEVAVGVKKIPRYLMVALAMALIAAGCGGGGSRSGAIADPVTSGSGGAEGIYPYSLDYEILLKVADSDGDPLGDVAVWIDDVPEEDKTEYDYSTLSSFYGEWEGYECNFISSVHSVRIRHSGDEATVTVRVSRTGYRTLTESFTVPDRPADLLLFRTTFIMAPDYI